MSDITPEELYEACTKIGVMGAVKDGLFHEIADSGSGSVSPIQHVSNSTQYSVDFDVVKENAALVVKNTLTAPTDSTSVVPTEVVETLITSKNNEPGHIIGVLNKMTVEADVETAFGVEYRVDATSGDVTGTYTAAKHVVGPDNQNGGVVENYCIERFDDMRNSVQNVKSITQEFLDPRIVTTHVGGNLRPADQILSSRTLTDSDSGKDFIVVSSGKVIITIGEKCSNGFSATFLQGSSGNIEFQVSPDKAFYSKANQVETNGPLATASIKIYPFGATLGTFVNS